MAKKLINLLIQSINVLQLGTHVWFIRILCLLSLWGGIRDVTRGTEVPCTILPRCYAMLAVTPPPPPPIFG